MNELESIDLTILCAECFLDGSRFTTVDVPKVEAVVLRIQLRAMFEIVLAKSGWVKRDAEWICPSCAQRAGEIE